MENQKMEKEREYNMSVQNNNPELIDAARKSIFERYDDLKNNSPEMIPGGDDSFIATVKMFQEIDRILLGQPPPRPKRDLDYYTDMSPAQFDSVTIREMNKIARAFPRSTYDELRDDCITERMNIL